MIWVRVGNLSTGMWRISFGVRRITWAVGALFTPDSLFPFIVRVLDGTVLLHKVTCRSQTGRQTQTARFHELHPNCDIQLPAWQGWHLVLGRSCAVMRVNIMFSSTHVKFTWNQTEKSDVRSSSPETPAETCHLQTWGSHAPLHAHRTFTSHELIKLYHFRHQYKPLRRPNWV